MANYLQAADVGVIQSLTTLGPWGLAAIAAYLLGQGLAELVKKVQLGSSGSMTVALTPDEEAHIKEAIAAMGSDVWAMSHPETMDWIRNNPPAEIPMEMRWPWQKGEEEVSDVVQREWQRELFEKYWDTFRTLNPNDPDFCDKLNKLMRRMEYNSDHVYPNVSDPRPSLYLRLLDMDRKYCLPKRQLEWQEKEAQMTEAERKAMEYRDAGPY